MDYAFESILINQREESLDDIQSGKAVPQSEFESSTFQFIRDWLNGAQEFSLQTSGSTGTPKSITITRKQMQRSARRTLDALGLQPRDTSLVCLATNFIAGKMMVVRAFEGNMKIVATEPSSDPFEKITKSLPIDFMAIVPLQLQTLLANSDYTSRLNKMKGILVGGAPVSEKLKEQVQRITCPVYETYGMTETISHIALRLLNTSNQSDSFQLLAGITVQLDARGCLVIDDDNLSGRILTNDLVQLIGPDKFLWLGRIDHVINSGGIKLSPEKIEQEVGRLFSSLNIQRNFFVAGLPNETLGQEVVVVVEGNPLSGEAYNSIRVDLSQRLSAYEVPRQILFLENFRYTPTGKINRAESTRLLSKE